MVTACVKDVWAVNLDLLEVFQKFCHEHGLRFFIGFGTLLGALRHQGFVPWDDDVDILMMRNDFERLKHLGAEFPQPYFLQSEISEAGFWYGGMMKFRRSNTTFLEHAFYQKRDSNHGIALEIMPLDNVADDSWEQRQQAKDIGRLQQLIWAKIHGEDLFKLRHGMSYISETKWLSIRKEAGKYTIHELLENFHRTCSCHTVYTNKRLGLYLFYNREDSYRVFERKWFDDCVMMDFENLQLPAPRGFWECLEVLYGRDFMNYVPRRERKPHHFAVWDTEAPYMVWQRRILDVYETKGRKVVIFGAGSMARNFIREMDGRLVIYGCVDNDARKQGKTFLGIKVYSPELLRTNPCEWHVIIANGYYREIGRQLESLGIMDYYVYVDEWQALFRPLDVGEYGSKDIENKTYRIAGIVVDRGEMDMNLFMWIKERKKECDYLICFIPRENEKMIMLLRELKLINRVVITSLTQDILSSRYSCDMIFAYDS